MNTNFIIWCIPFFIMSIFHLSMCLAENKKRADFSKILLMPLLFVGMLGYIFTTKGIGSINIFVVLLSAGILFGGLGDYFLIQEKNESNFTKGLSSFFVGHIFYLILIFIVVDFFTLPLIQTIIAGVIYLAILIITWIQLKKPKGKIGFAVVVYVALLLSFNAISLYLFVGQGLEFGFTTIPFTTISLLIGTTLFLISDAVLSFTIFVKQFPKQRFIVMVTYLAAQFFIVYALSHI